MSRANTSRCNITVIGVGSHTNISNPASSASQHITNDYIFYRTGDSHFTVIRLFNFEGSPLNETDRSRSKVPLTIHTAVTVNLIFHHLPIT